MTKIPKPKPKARPAVKVGPIVRLIRAAAKQQEVSAGALSNRAGIAYSRAWELLCGNGHRKLANIERALATLAPDVVAQIEKAAERMERP